MSKFFMLSCVFIKICALNSSAFQTYLMLEANRLSLNREEDLTKSLGGCELYFFVSLQV